MTLDYILTQGHIATALLIIAAVLAYYVLVIKDRERLSKEKRK